MSKFEYPRLPREEIVAILANPLNIINISKADLINPNPDFVSNLYTRLLLHLNCLPEDEHGQVDFAALEPLDPDDHVDSVRTFILFSKIKDLVEAVKCPRKFTLNDLIEPVGDRTEFFLSGIVNYCIHRHLKMDCVKEIMDGMNPFYEQQEDLEARILQLKEETTELNESREMEMPVVQEIDAKVKELRQTIPGLNNHQMSLKAKIRKMKERAKEMDEKISIAEFALVQSVQDNANLRSKIVQSPEKLQRALEEKKTGRDKAKNAERAALQTFQERTDIVDVYTKAYKKMSKQFAQMQAIQEQVNSVKSIEKDVKVLKVKLSDEAVLDKSLEAKLVEWQRKVYQLDELRKQLGNERDLKCEEATKESNNVKFEVEFTRGDMEAKKMKVEAVVAETDAITAKINLVKESGAAKCQELDRKCDKIAREFHQYLSSIGNLLPGI